MNLRKGYIYRYKDNKQEPLCIYLCDTQAKSKILIVPLTEKGNGNVYKLSVTKQYASLDDYKEINTENISSVLYLNSKPVRVPDSDLYAIHHFILDDIMKKNLLRCTLQQCIAPAIRNFISISKMEMAETAFKC